MSVELTVLEMVLGSILAFLAGLFGLLYYYERRSSPGQAPDGQQASHLERLEQYESQLVGMKIRLDAMSLDAEEPRARPGESAQAAAASDGGEKAAPDPKAASAPPVEERPPTLGTRQSTDMPLDLTSHILQLITSKSMTSRDIQITVGRTREHTSRLMKRLAEEGLVERHSASRPYTYSITPYGRERLAAQGDKAPSQQQQQGTAQDRA